MVYTFNVCKCTRRKLTRCRSYNGEGPASQHHLLSFSHFFILNRDGLSIRKRPVAT